MGEAEQTYNWICDIIKSCSNTFHFEAVDRIIGLFEAKYGEGELTTNLKLLKTAKWNSVHMILV
jgi:hypothetical protein